MLVGARLLGSAAELCGLEAAMMSLETGLWSLGPDRLVLDSQLTPVADA